MRFLLSRCTLIACGNAENFGMSAIRADIILIEAGKGATFIFDIRIHDVDAGYIEIPASSRRVVGIEPGFSRFEILIVDDNKDNRKLLLKLLEPFQFELNEAENGREAVEIWRDWRPDLIWMDIRMPVMDGYEFVETIREIEEKYPNAPKPSSSPRQPVVSRWNGKKCWARDATDS